MKRIKYLFPVIVALVCAATALSSCGKDDDDNSNPLVSYDVIQINGESFACYGYRCAITYTSTWDLKTHSGDVTLPCGKLSDAQKGEYDYDYLYTIDLQGKQDLQKGSKLEDFSPTLTTVEDFMEDYAYESGSATITDKVDDEYITVKFENFKCVSGSKSYVINGTVQLDLDED